MVDKIVENEVWRESVKDLKNEEAAMKHFREDLIDSLTKEFFLDNFNEIKDEYLKGYKEAVKRSEEGLKEPPTFNIIRYESGIRQNDNSTKS
jgi:hypothetical protein